MSFERVLLEFAQRPPGGNMEVMDLAARLLRRP